MFATVASLAGDVLWKNSSTRQEWLNVYMRILL
jgi:hypothetical protein